MEETITKPDYTQEQLNKMSYKKLREVAIQRGLNHVGKKLKELRMMLGAAPKNATVVDNAEGMSTEELIRRREMKERIPKQTIYKDKDEDAFWKMRERNPDAFDNVDFTDVTSKAQHIFSPNVKCVRCGTKFKMRREYQKRKDGVLQTFVEKKNCEIKKCPNCDVWYYYHDVNIEAEIFAE